MKPIYEIDKQANNNEIQSGEINQISKEQDEKNTKVPEKDNNVSNEETLATVMIEQQDDPSNADKDKQTT